MSLLKIIVFIFLFYIIRKVWSLYTMFRQAKIKFEQQAQKAHDQAQGNIVEAEYTVLSQEKT